MDISDLELLFSSPRDYIVDYFNNIRNEINTVYETQKKAKTTEEIRKKLEINYDNLMNKLKSIQEDCLKHMLTNKYELKITVESGQIIEQIKSKIEYVNTTFNDETTEDLDEYESYEREQEYNALCAEIDQLIYNQITKLEQIALNNKTVLFLQEKESKIPDFFESMDYLTTVGKLIVFNDKYFSRECLSGITNKFHMDISFTSLTNDLVKSINIKKILEKNKSSNQIDEFNINDYDFEKIEIINRQVKELDPACFQDIKGVRLIDLNFNMFKSIDERIFNGLSGLQIVNLLKNKLTSIPVNLFSGLTSLKEIYLRENQLKQLDGRAFNGLANLETLDLTSNLLRSLDVNTFKGLSKLKELYLGCNLLKEIDPNIFKDLVSINEINLSHNQLERVDLHFNGLATLKCLALHENHLNSIDANAFNGLDSVEKILLNNNELKTLDANLFSKLNNLKNVFLYDNQFENDQKRNDLFKFAHKNVEVLFV